MTLPSNGSKNPVEGVIRCSCGEIATVHRPRGKRSAFLYTICPSCGTDQRTGAPVQKRIQDNMAACVDELPPQTENKPKQTENKPNQTEPDKPNPDTPETEPDPLSLGLLAFGAVLLLNLFGSGVKPNQPQTLNPKGQ